MAKYSPSRPPTAHDVARLVRVSQSAVSRAFTAGAGMTAGKRDEIITAARQLGCRPNIVARSLDKGTSKVAGIVFGNFGNRFFVQAFRQFSDELARFALGVLLFTADTNATVDEQVTELLSYRVNSVILMAVHRWSALAAECARSNRPVAMFNRTTAQDIAAFTVTGDNSAGAPAIAMRFLKTGRTRTAFMLL